MKKCKFLPLLFIFSLSISASEIVYLGDSLSANDSFGKELYKTLKTKDPLLHFEALCGASPKWWLKGGIKTSCGSKLNSSWSKTGTSSNLTKLIEKKDPKLLIVQLGTNLLTGAVSKTSLESNISAFINAIPSNVDCIWIGPPDAADAKISDSTFNLFYSVLINVSNGHCKLIDSRKGETITQYPDDGSGDGIHFYGKLQNIEENKWIKYVLKNLSI